MKEEKLGSPMHIGILVALGCFMLFMLGFTSYKKGYENGIHDGWWRGTDNLPMYESK